MAKKLEQVAPKVGEVVGVLVPVAQAETKNLPRAGETDLRVRGSRTRYRVTLNGSVQA